MQKIGLKSQGLQTGGLKVCHSLGDLENKKWDKCKRNPMTDQSLTLKEGVALVTQTVIAHVNT